jgi:hypothetical protein
MKTLEDVEIGASAATSPGNDNGKVSINCDDVDRWRMPIDRSEHKFDMANPNRHG